MATIEINVDENVLTDAKNVLNRIGMDIPIAVNIFLRRVSIEKGLPFSLVVSEPPKEPQHDDNTEIYTYQPRSNSTISPEMTQEVWNAFTEYLRGLGEINPLSDKVAEISGMNRGSAFIYLTMLANLSKAEGNTRTMKMKDLEFFMEKIKSELSTEIYHDAIKSLERSVPYWKSKLGGSFGEKVERNLKTIWKAEV